MKNSNKIPEKSEKNKEWLVMMLGLLFQGPGCSSKYGRCGYAKMKHGNEIVENSEKMGDGW
jgi:hypothetical protein